MSREITPPPPPGETPWDLIMRIMWPVQKPAEAKAIIKASTDKIQAKLKI